jgi:hypothetical protein
MSELFALIGFIANLIFFIWFGATLNSINRHLRNLDHHFGEPESGMSVPAGEAPVPADWKYRCPKCKTPADKGTEVCAGCGKAFDWSRTT